MRVHRFSFLFSLMVVLPFLVQPARAQRGSLVVRVSPPQTYIYADGQPVIESKGHYLTLAAGEHKIDLYNHGFKPESRNVTIEAGKTAVIDVTMRAIPGMVTGPWGCITIEGPRGAAVLLNGKDPEGFFVGHVDEFNNEWIWHQELIVPPGKHGLTIAAPLHDSWTTSVEIQANKRVVVQAYNGVVKTVDWPRGQQLAEIPPFHAGIASAWVAVEKVSGTFAVTPGQVNCGEPARLVWSSSGAAKTELNNAPVSTSGDQTVQPKQTTSYKFVAEGPGGVYTADATVNVDPAISASLSISPAEVRLNGGGADPPGTATLTWSAANADSVTLDPIGSVGASGSRAVAVTPQPNSGGPLNQTMTYTLRASNACGASETRTATLHITGGALQATADEATSNLRFTSIYFPTDLPSAADRQGGVVLSQERRLQEAVSSLQQYLKIHPDVEVILEGHADDRGSVRYNQALSQRRADRVKSYLLEHGIASGRIKTAAYGKARNLTRKQVESLATDNPHVSAQERRQVLHHIIIFCWANNRRVDLRLSTGLASQRDFPYDANDLKVLLGVKESGGRQSASLR